MPSEPTVFIVDDDAAIREGLGALLRAKGYAVEAHVSAEAFLAAANLDRVPACVLADIRMPGISGLELQRDLKQRAVNLPVIVITGHGDVSQAVAALKAGAVDFLEKPFTNAAILEAIECALGRGAGPDPAAVHEGLASLTARERDVLEHLTIGMSSREIGERLGISARTVDVHRGNLLTKLGARNTADLIRIVVSARHAGKS